MGYRSCLFMCVKAHYIPANPLRYLMTVAFCHCGLNIFSTTFGILVAPFLIIQYIRCGIFVPMITAVGLFFIQYDVSSNNWLALSIILLWKRTSLNCHYIANFYKLIHSHGRDFKSLYIVLQSLYIIFNCLWQSHDKCSMHWNHKRDHISHNYWRITDSDSYVCMFVYVQWKYVSCMYGMNNDHNFMGQNLTNSNISVGTLSIDCSLCLGFNYYSHQDMSKWNTDFWMSRDLFPIWYGKQQADIIKSLKNIHFL